MSQLVFRIAVEHFLESRCSLIKLTRVDLHITEGKISIDIVLVQTHSFTVVIGGFLDILHICEGYCDVEMTVRRLTELEGLHVCVDRLVKLLDHEQGISEVIIDGVGRLVEIQSLLVSLDSLIVVS